jgi:hypothetical protein
MSLTTYDATLLLFSSIAAGPAGVEPAIQAAGLTNTAIGIVVIQILFGGPQSFIVLALVKGTGGSHDGGSVYWAGQLAGRHARRTMAVLEVVASCATAAAVAQISESYISTLMAGGVDQLIVYAITVSAVVFAFTACAISLRAVIRACGVFSLFTFAAYSVFFGMSFHKINLKRLTRPRINGVQWPTLLNYLVFNASGYDSAATLGEEMNSAARRNIPVVILVVMTCTSIMYIFTLAAAYLGSNLPEAEWRVGTFAVVAREIGGTKLRAAIVAASVGSMFQMFTTSFEMATVAAKVGFEQKRRTNLLLVFGLSLGFCFIPTDISLSIQSVLYGLAYAAQIYLYTLLKNDVKLSLYLFLAVSLVFCTVIVAIQPWYTILASTGLILFSFFVSIAF